MRSGQRATVIIEPGPLRGVVTAPPSKSVTVRAIAASLLARGTSTIDNASICDDAQTAIEVATALGARVRRLDPSWQAPPAQVTSSATAPAARLLVEGGLTGAEASGGGAEPSPAPEAPPLELCCGESALTLRLFAPIAALTGRPVVLSGRGSLQRRPVDMVEHALSELGAAVRSDRGRAPLSLRGPLQAGPLEVDASETSQLLSGLLMALPTCPGDSEIAVRRLHSRGYVALTRSVMAAFGVSVEALDGDGFRIAGGQDYRSARYEVEGDYSGAACLLVAGAIAGAVQLRGLAVDSLQPDAQVVDLLRRAGAEVAIRAGAVDVGRAPLQPFEFDATGCPDLFPALAVLATACPGTSVVQGVGRLRDKESDRASALVRELSKMNVAVDIHGDQLRVTGGDLVGAALDAHDDHRIAMALAVAATRAHGPVTLHNAGCVTKSYPSFFTDLAALGANLR